MVPLHVSLLGLANHLWQSTLFAALVGGLTLSLKGNSAVVRYRLWLIASVKFLVPFSLLIGIGGQLGWKPIRAFPQSGVPVAIRQISQPFVVPPSMPPSFQTSPSMPAGASPVAVILAVAWTLGSAVVLLTWWRKWARIARVVRKAGVFESSGRFNPALAAKRVPILSSPEGMEPGIFGIFRPVLLLPKGVARNLSGRQLDSILVHEMVHVRGRDNMASALHTIVEALFWFHPMVWWLGNRLVVERERACDEAVLQMGCDPADYAEGILKICKSYLTAPACMAGIGGTHLKNRIEAIMENRRSQHLNIGKKLLLTLAATGTIAVPLLTGIIDAAESPLTSLRALPAVVAPPPQTQEPAAAPQQVGKVANPPQNRWTAGVVYTIPASSPPQNRWAAGITWVVQAASASQDKRLDDVAYIITDDERKAFNKLTTDQERDSFFTNFWLVRDPTPGTPANEFKDEYYTRIAYANDHFSQPGLTGSKSDRGRMYILNGPPDEIVSHPGGGSYDRPGGGTTQTFPFETWRYRHLDGKGDNMIYEFIDRQLNGDYRLEYDPAAKQR